MVRLVDFPRVRLRLARHEQVVSRVGEVLVDSFTVEGRGDFHLLAPDGLGLEVHVLGRVAELLADDFPVPDLGLEPLDHPVDLPPLLRGQGGVVGDDPLLFDGELRLPGIVGVDSAFVFELVDAFLVTVPQAPASVPDVVPLVGLFVGQKDPLLLRFAQVPPVDGFGEDVAVVRLLRGRVYVPRAVQALVGDLDDAPRHAVPGLHVLDPPPKVGLLGLVARVELHVQGYHVGVEQKGLPDDRVVPPFLGRALPPPFVLTVDLEVVVGAVEVADAEPPFPFLRDEVVEHLYVFMEVLADEVHAVEDLVVGVRFRPVEVRDDVAEYPELAARLDDLGVGQRLEERREVVLGLAQLGDDVEVPVESLAQGVEGGLCQEVTGVLGRRGVADLPFLGEGVAAVQFVYLPLRPRDRVVDAFRLQLRDVAEGFVGPVLVALAGDVVGPVDLQVEALLGGHGLLQEIPHNMH